MAKYVILFAFEKCYFNCMYVILGLPKFDFLIFHVVSQAHQSFFELLLCILQLFHANLMIFFMSFLWYKSFDTFFNSNMVIVHDFLVKSNSPYMKLDSPIPWCIELDPLGFSSSLSHFELLAPWASINELMLTRQVFF